MLIIFSPSEEKVLKILGRKRMKLSAITDKFYEDRDLPPLNANILIASVVRRINSKCNYLKADWWIAGEGLGRGGKTVWRELKPSRYR